MNLSKDGWANYLDNTQNIIKVVMDFNRLEYYHNWSTTDSATVQDLIAKTKLAATMIKDNCY